MSPRKHEPEARPVGHWSQREFLHVSASRWLVVAGIAAMLGVPATLNRPIPLPNPPPMPVEPQLPLQEWATDAGLPMLTSIIIPGTLPPPLPAQKTGGCDVEAGEQEIRGGCWTPIEGKIPPCPKKLWPYDGKCWRPIPRTARPPTTGNPRTGAVAGD